MTAHHDTALAGYLATLDEPTLADAEALIAMMRRVTGQEPTLWNVGTIGFGTYHYKYDTGREGDGHTIGFYPRKGKLTIYLMDGTTRYADLLAKLGTHTTTGYCIYLKRLSDVDPALLEQLVTESYENVSTQAKQGPIREILWKADPKGGARSS